MLEYVHYAEERHPGALNETVISDFPSVASTLDTQPQGVSKTVTAVTLTVTVGAG